MKYTSFQENRFKSSVNKAIKVVDRILDAQRHPVLASEEAHTYDDKYALAELLTNTAIAAQVNALEQLGLDLNTIQSIIRALLLPSAVDDDSKNSSDDDSKEKKKTINKKSQTQKQVALKFEAEDSCSFLKEQKTKIEPPDNDDSRNLTIASPKRSSSPPASMSNMNPAAIFGAGSGMPSASREKRNIKETPPPRATTKIEYHWQIRVSYTLSIKVTERDNSNNNTKSKKDKEANTVPSKSMEMSVTLQQRDSSIVLVTTKGRQFAPLPAYTKHKPIDLDITWLLQQLEEKDNSTVICTFFIDRENKEICKTPRRNKQTQEAIDFFQAMHNWSHNIHHYFTNRVEAQILSRYYQQVRQAQQQQKPQQGNGSKERTGIIPALPAMPALKSVTADDLFCPIIPLMEKQQQKQSKMKHVEKQKIKKHLLDDHDTSESAEDDHDDDYDTDDDPKGISSIRSGNILPQAPIYNSWVMVGQCTNTRRSSDFYYSSSPLLKLTDLDTFLNEQIRSLEETKAKYNAAFPSSKEKFISNTDIAMLLMCLHNQELSLQYQDAMDYIEEILRQQLIAAIGKELSVKGFRKYMSFHNGSKLFKQSEPKYKPKLFCYTVNRPNHYPDGILSISLPREKNEPIETLVRYIPSNNNIKSSSFTVPLSAATHLTITGDKFIHGWIQHRFMKKMKENFQIMARARQFSNFILMIGTFKAPNVFEPKNALILQDKDQIIIPLLTNALHSTTTTAETTKGGVGAAKTFEQDPTIALSPDQQEFVESYREMQLESDLFGICLIQIKPHLEKLLGLPEDYLTKDIQLTQDIIKLFVDYNIPSDLISYHECNSAFSKNSSSASLPQERIETVKRQVKGVLEFIEKERKRQQQQYQAQQKQAAEASGGGRGVPKPGKMNGNNNQSNNNRGGAATASLTPGGGGGGSAGGGSLMLEEVDDSAIVPASPVYDEEDTEPAAQHQYRPENSQQLYHNQQIDEYDSVDNSSTEDSVSQTSSQLSLDDPSDGPITSTTTASTILPLIPQDISYSSNKDKKRKSKLSRKKVSPSLSSSPKNKKNNIYTSKKKMKQNRGVTWTPSTEGNDDNNNNSFSSVKETGTLAGATGPSSLDPNNIVLMPSILNEAIQQFDTNNSLRLNTLKAGAPWIRRRFEYSFLTNFDDIGGSRGGISSNFAAAIGVGMGGTSIIPPTDQPLTLAQITNERRKAFDLLDAMSRNGTLPIQDAELHVLIPVTHCFENDILGTIIQDNINPIEKVEKSTLLVASVIHGGIPIDELLTSNNGIEKKTMDDNNKNPTGEFASDKQKKEYTNEESKFLDENNDITSQTSSDDFVKESRKHSNSSKDRRRKKERSPVRGRDYSSKHSDKDYSPKRKSEHKRRGDSGERMKSL